MYPPFLGLGPYFSAIEHSTAYRVMLVFYGSYPVIMSIAWIVFSTTFRLRQEHPDKRVALQGPLPMVSIIVPAFREEAVIGNTLDVLKQISYPNFEVIVVNDGSPDATAVRVREHLSDPRIRLLDKQVNEGKAMALNDAVIVARGEVLLIIDADIAVAPDILDFMVPHFLSPRVAAVTGNPRVENRHNLFQNLQAVEFSSIVSMQRRAQRVWGRVMTVSGAVFALRKSALVDVGMFSPAMATEDIELTWRLQKKFWDVRYEPNAVVRMQVPPNLRELWKQRARWATGLAQVLRKHSNVVLDWRTRRLWPVFIESWLSIAWAYTFVSMTLYWLFCRSVGHHPIGASPIPNFWGMVIATVCLVQLTLGAFIDRRYDRNILKSLPEMVWYPIIYWMLMAIVSCIYTLKAFVTRPPQLQRWNIERSAK